MYKSKRVDLPVTMYGASDYIKKCIEVIMVTVSMLNGLQMKYIVRRLSMGKTTGMALNIIYSVGFASLVLSDL